MEVNYTYLHQQMHTSAKSTLKHVTYSMVSWKIVLMINTFPQSLPLKKELINASNGHDYEDTMEELKSSCYRDDVDIPTLARHLQLLQDVIKQCNPEVKKNTYDRDET